MTYGGIFANVAGTAARYGLKVGGVSQIGSSTSINGADLNVAPIRLSLQGPGGASQLTFSVKQDSTGPTGIAPYWGGAEVLLYDYSVTPSLMFKGKVVHTRSRRGGVVRQGGVTQQVRIVDITAQGMDYYLDKRVIDSIKTRTNTSGRVRQFSNDDDWVKRIMEKAGLNEMVQAGTYIDQTATDLDPMHFKAMTVRECLDEICDQAQPVSDYRVRRYYVDGPGQLHYYQSPEGLTPPARISDASFYTGIVNTSGIVEFWSGQLLDSSTCLGHLGVKDLTLNGGVLTEQPSLCYNLPGWLSIRLNGTTGYGSASSNSLHPGNTGTWGIVFKRGQTATAETLWSGGTDDILIGFDSSDHIIVQKEGTGNAFVSDHAYDNTTYTYFLVVTHSGSGTNVYVNGDAISGTTTSRTLSAGTGFINIGRKKSTTDTFFKGRVWGAWVSSSELSANAVASLNQLWISIVAESVETERDSTDVTRHVFVKGGPAPGSGWVAFQNNGNPLSEQVLFDPLPEEVIDRPDTHVDGDATATKRKRMKFGMAYMADKAETQVAVTFTATLDPADILIEGRQQTFRPGQTIVITSDADNLSNYTTEIRSVDVDLNLGNGVQTFEVSCGALPASALRRFRTLMGS